MEKNNLSSRWQPINESNPLCIQTNAELCIYNIDPDLITEKLGIIPSLRSKKGFPDKKPSGKVVIGRVNSWLLFSENSISSKDLRNHLDWLMDEIEPVIPQLLELQTIPEAKMSVRCSYWSTESDGATIVLWPEQMERLAKANLEFSLEITCYGDEKEKDNTKTDEP